ncbi:MAG: sigma-70 family RNA polymerase sigma factor [Planctomycetes bacterium]|nr:sigma-70 family RNA polymerase sigma factor [Planctomycetota bacterium]
MPDPISDVDLLLAAGRGDAASFETLYSRYGKPIFNFFYRMCWDPVVSEDCAQEVFLRAWRAAPAWRPEAKVSTWLFAIAQNYWLNERAKAGHRPVPFTTLGTGDPEGSVSEGPVPALSRMPGPGDRLAGEEVREAVRQAIDALSEKEKIVVILGEMQGMKYREIAEVLGIPVGTVKSRMSEATRRLRQSLGPLIERPEEG